MVGWRQVGADVATGREGDRGVGCTYRQGTRCAVVVGYVGQEAQTRRGRQQQCSGIARSRPDVDAADDDPTAADVVVVLPDALRRCIGHIANDGDATKRRGRVATTSDCRAVIRSVAVSKAQRRDSRTRRTGQVFGGGRQDGGAGRWLVIDIGNGGADGAAGGIPGASGAGAAIGGNVVGIGVGGADLAR